MNFPNYQVPWLGKGMVIGLNAVIHVIISHGIAIGTIFMIALAELIAYRRNRPTWDHMAYKSLILPVVIITSVGASTGFGIWVTIGALAPRASASMLRIFFWPWFWEWMAFVIEAVIIVAYYLTWQKMGATRRAKKWHIIIGFSYPSLGLISAFLISGILGFMLTPEGFPWNHSYFDAFFNVSLWPQTFLRVFGGLTMGTLFFIALISFNDVDDGARRDALRLYSLLFILFAVPAFILTWNVYFPRIPRTYFTHAIFCLLTSHLSQSVWAFYLANYVFLGFLFLLVLFAFLKFRQATRVMIIPALLASFFFVTEFERVREFIRGPFLMPGYMYVSQILLKEAPELMEAGALSRSYWYNAAFPRPSEREIGEALFGNNCTTCHTIGGLNSIRDRLQGRTEESIYVIIGHANELAPFMPPLIVSDAERRVLAHYLYEVTNHQVYTFTPSRFPERKEGPRD
jgi:mono/diheme cytochrome c family protein